MTSGLGAAFGALVLLAALLVLAVLLALAAGAAVGLRHRSGEAHSALQYGAAGLVVPVVAVAGFGVAALSDEAPAAAAVFVALVFVPLVGATVALRGDDAGAWADTAAVAGLSWGPSYLLGIAVLFALVVGLTPALGLAPDEVRQYGLPWVWTAVSGLVVLVGAIAAARRLSALLAIEAAEPDNQSTV